MRKLANAVLAITFSSLIAAALCGCGGGGGTASSVQATGVEAVGALGSTLGVRSGGEGPGEMNPNYPNAYQVPSTLTVALGKLEMLKGVDDTSPYVIFDAGSVASARTISLTDNGGAQSFGENSEYPEPGTYTHLRVTLVYQELTVKADLADGLGYADHRFRVYHSTVGNAVQGDVVVYKNGEFQWIKGGNYFPMSGSRPGDDVPGTLVRQMHFINDNSPDPEVSTVALASPMVVPANPTGKYTITATFDVTHSPEAADSTGIFMWDDVTADGQFKPAVDKADGGDGNSSEVEQFGPADWTPLSPVITFHYTQSQ